MIASSSGYEFIIVLILLGFLLMGLIELVVRHTDREPKEHNKRQLMKELDNHGTESDRSS